MTENQSSSQFNEFYYQHCCGEPYVRNDKWLGVFRHFAFNIKSLIPAKTVLDAGCAKGFLVEALREQGMEAYGVDISSSAIGEAYESIKPYVRVGSLTEPLNQRYDLIVTIEVIEHIPASDALKAIANLCAASDDILFSSSPFDYDEPTHINVHPPEYWAVQFAKHGFFRDCSFDGSFLTPWTVRYRKRDRTLLELVQEYERWNWEARQAEFGSRRHATSVQAKLAEASEKLAQFDAMAQRVAAMEVQLETERDVSTRAQRDLLRIAQERDSALAEKEAIVNSRSGKLVKTIQTGASLFKGPR